MSLRHRSGLSSKSSKSPSNSRNRQRARQKLAAATRWVAESLESRVLLTTLHGGGAAGVPGDTLEFLGENSVNQPFTPVYEKITLFGNITAEVIGTNVDDNAAPTLENLPGQLDGVDVNGGFALDPGVTPVGQLPNDIQSIAVDPATGIIYGTTLDVGSLSFTTGNPPMTTTAAYNFVNLVTIDPATGATTPVPNGNIDMQLLAADGIQVGPTNTPLVASIPAMTFFNGQLFLVDSIGAGGGGGGGGGNEHLVALDPADPQNTVGQFQGTFNGVQINALAPITNANGTTALFGASGTAVFPINLNSTNNDPAGTTITANGPIAGLAQNAAGKIFITTNNANATSEVYWINPIQTTPDNATGGDAVDYGPLPDTAVVNNALQSVGVLGDNPGTMTYDPNTDTLYSFDQGTNTFITVSQTIRTRSLSLFQIYISQSDSTGQIFTSEAQVPTTEGGRTGYMTPYGGGLNGGLMVTSAQTGLVINVASPATEGTAIVGARSRHLVPNVTNDVGFPITVGVIPDATLFPAAPFTTGELVDSGFTSGPGTTVGEISDAGPILGDVHFNGSIDTFYASWLLTGDAGGGPLDNIDDPGNFSVAGDLRNLLVSNSIGTDSDAALLQPTYVTGFDMHVTGTIGRVQTFDSLIGNVSDVQSPTAQNLSTNIQETEIRTVMVPDPWDLGELGGTTQFNNDTFGTAQDVGSLPTSVNGLPSAAVINGTLQADNVQADFVDYYGVALLAGQTITAQVVSLLDPDTLDLGIFNPDGDLVATDYNNVQPILTEELPFRFTADRPGVYRFAVATAGNPIFTDATNALQVPDDTYQLTIQGVGDIAVGAIVALNNILDNVDPTIPEPSFGVQVGDLGAVSAGGNVMSTNVGNTVLIEDGSLRDMDGASIGLLNGTAVGADPEINVPVGSVGLISATSAAGVLFFNVQGPTTPAIGGDYQLLSAAGGFDADLVADGSIGVVRAASMTIGVPIFHVNAGNSSTPGNIDLIDVAGNFGTLNGGGPEIMTGALGNVGYLRVGGQVFQDAFFGSGQPDYTLYQPGASVTLTDDSGAQVTLTPTGTPSVAASVGVSNDTSGTTVNPALPQLAVTAYGIEGSGGVAICNVTSTGGLTMTSSGDETGQTVQIGEIDVLGLGQGLVVTPAKPTTTNTQPPAPGTTTTGGTTTTTTAAPTFFTGADTAGPVGRTLPLAAPPMLNPNSESPLNVIINGSAQAGAFEVYGGFITTIDNETTGGEIVNVNAESIGSLISKGTIGLSTNHTGAGLNGQMAAGPNLGAFPLIDEHNAIVQEGTIPAKAFPAWGIIGFAPGLGQVITAATTTTTTLNSSTTTTTVLTPVAVGAPEVGIATITAPSLGNIDCGGTIGTIQGSILAPVFTSATINHVILQGAGVASSGSGTKPNAGVYAIGQIGMVTNSGTVNIRGTIASTTGLTGINLKNGSSIISATVAVVTNLNMTLANTTLFLIPNYNTPITNPVLDVGNIILQGNGGIIGSNFIGDHIGHVDVSHGFGIFETAFGVLGDGTLAGVLADGYGLRGVTFDGGGSIGSLVAAGDGRSVSTQTYSSDARLSETDSFDPFTGFQPNFLSDIDMLTGATAQQPQVAPQGGFGTDTGVIADSEFIGDRTLGSVRAYQIRATDPINLPTLFDFANSVGTITTLSSDDGVSLTTGKMQNFHPGGNLDHLTFQIAGPIQKLTLNGNVTSNSIISASGRNGNIGTLKVTGDLQGSVTAARKINSATIGGNLTGTVSAKGINSLRVLGQLNGGNLDIEGNVNKLFFGGDLGLPDETLTIHGSAKVIQINGNLNADISVEGNVGSLIVGQSVITGTLTDVDGTLNSLLIDGDLQAGATIQATSIRHQRIKGLNQGMVIG